MGLVAHLASEFPVALALALALALPLGAGALEMAPVASAPTPLDT